MGVISIIIEVPKRLGTYETFQKEQIDGEERTGNRPQWAPVLDGQAEGEGYVEKRRSREAKKAFKGKGYRQGKAMIMVYSSAKGRLNFKNRIHSSRM